MKNKILSLLASFALIVLFSACDDHKYGSEPESYGKLSFTNFDISVDQSKSDAESRAIQTVDVSNYIVTITKKGAKQPAVNKSFGQLPGVVDLATGEYTIKVESHKLAKAAFDAPYYLGTQDVKIEEDKVCDAGTIICKFASVGVQVTFSEKLTPLLGDDVVVTVSSTDGAKLEYKKNVTRTGYFEYINGSTTLLARLTGTVNGKLIEEDNTQVIENVAPGKVFVLRFKVKGLPDKPDETGAITITPGEGVSIDTSVIESDDNNISGGVKVDEDIIGDVQRPGQEDPGTTTPPDDPTPPTDVDAIKVTSSTINLDGGVNDINGESYIVNILAENGLANLKVQIVSDYLTNDFLESVHLRDSFDLAYPGDLEVGLSGLGFPTGDGVIGQTKIDFDLTNFIPLLGSAVGMQHSFVLTIIDSKGNSVTKTLKFQS